jgi:hypothetical protein
VDLAFALPAGLVILASLLAYGEYFAPFARHFVLFVALLANTAALWLVFQRIRFRLRSEALTDQCPEESAAEETSIDGAPLVMSQ